MLVDWMISCTVAAYNLNSHAGVFSCEAVRKCDKVGVRPDQCVICMEL